MSLNITSCSQNQTVNCQAGFYFIRVTFATQSNRATRVSLPGRRKPCIGLTLIEVPSYSRIQEISTVAPATTFNYAGLYHFTSEVLAYSYIQFRPFSRMTSLTILIVYTSTSGHHPCNWYNQRFCSFSLIQIICRYSSRNLAPFNTATGYLFTFGRNVVFVSVSFVSCNCWYTILELRGSD